MPVTIVTGFLGSGKTTVLNQLLRAAVDLADTVVIINEFGAVGLDHLLIEQAIEDAVLLKNGCICCTVRGDIADTIDELFRQRARPANCHRSAASRSRPPGSPIRRRWRTRCWPNLARAMPVGLTASSPRWTRCMARMQLERQPEARRQVAMADRILLTKTDLVTPAEAEAVEPAIRTYNSQALVRRVVDGDVMPDRRFRAGTGGAPDELATSSEPRA